MSLGSLFHKIRVCRLKECWYDEVLACWMEMHWELLLYGMVLKVIGASGNSVIYFVILNRWLNFTCILLVFNDGNFTVCKRSS